jgi:hypothetical protein
MNRSANRLPPYQSEEAFAVPQFLFLVPKLLLGNEEEVRDGY